MFIVLTHDDAEVMMAMVRTQGHKVISGSQNALFFILVSPGHSHF